MTKVRKQKRRKRYQYNVNRKRMNKKRLPALGSKTVKNAWNRNISSKKNFKDMGLAFDVNKDIQTLNKEETTVELKTVDIKEAKVTPVIEELEKDAHAPREKGYRLPKHQVEYLIYLLDKYGEDYKAMARDKRNYLQQTWKQLRAKIKTFKSIPEQYSEYLKTKNNENGEVKSL